MYYVVQDVDSGRYLTAWSIFYDEHMNIVYATQSGWYGLTFHTYYRTCLKFLHQMELEVYDCGLDKKLRIVEVDRSAMQEGKTIYEYITK